MWELYLRKLIFKNLPVWDLLGGPVVKNLPSKKRKEESAFQNRGHGFDPLPGKIPHATEQLNPCATTSKPEL